ncbi:flagellar hook-basal body complex protein [Thermodesulfobacterium sp. TA1]|uniref:flagellar hook-basal body complex protein n=1 Tax=Thermodesulfobacterium sp. TA1 TaxID=2234087 RepID=UPI0012319B9F|nr:flagellar hook-basal body complex protein [Thermodesulfobacterium sp. TA1]QER41354.1 flagellar hook-basal body complex protein [Thermodesulfobacterium sp. TA1]
MGLTDALFTGTSGLRALGHGMSVIGDNVSNLNTTAFKGARISFSDVMAQSINTGAGSGQLGRGASIQALYSLFNQGSFESTANPTDMAIAGAGFFIVKDPKSTGNVFYTRDGQFIVDRNGYLVNAAGLRVQGWRIDEVTGDITGAITDIQIDRSSPPVKTSKIDVITNLDAREETRTKLIFLSGNLYDDPSDSTYTYFPNTGYYEVVIRDVDEKDNKIGIKLGYNAATQKWAYEIYNLDTNQMITSATDVTSTRVIFELPTTKEMITFDWSGITHVSGTNDIKMPGRTGRIELYDNIFPDQWVTIDFIAPTDPQVVDANGTQRKLRIYIKYDSSDGRWDYRVFENPANTPATNPDDPTQETGTLLVKGDNSDETNIFFFLDGTTQRINLDWSNLNPTGGTPTAKVFTLQETDTLLSYWDARQDVPIPSTAYSYRTTLTVYDSLGTPHEITVYYNPTTKDNVYEFLVACNPNEDVRDFTKDVLPMQWQYEEGTITQNLQIPSGNLTAQSLKGVLMYGRLEFDNQGNVKKFYETYRIDANTGALVQVIDTSGNPVADPIDKFSALGAHGYPVMIADFLGIEFPYDIYPPNSQDQGLVRNDLQQIELNFGYFFKDSWRSESVRTTQYATSNATIFYDQDGFGPGALESITVDNQGIITGNYSNGRVIPLWMVSLANFNAPERLQKVGGNLFKETTHSGPPVTGKPGSNGLGTIAPNSIEQSNVDLGEQFVKMIIFQRGFQADSRIITVSDTMLEELINLKR